MQSTIADAITQIGNAINDLKEQFPHKEFTMDGRLVGDIGEVIAEVAYDIELYDKVVKDYDAETPDGKKVQIKATFKDVLTLRKTTDYYLGLKLYEDGTFDEIYNGPGKYIEEKLSHRKGYGEKLIPLTNAQLKKISDSIPPSERIALRSVQEHESVNQESKLSAQKLSIEDLINKYEGQTLSIPNLRGKDFKVEIRKDGVNVSNLGNLPFLPWKVFEISIALLIDRKRILKGNAMSGRLGDDILPLNSLEGKIAQEIYHRQIGDSVFRRITPIANILIWMKQCRNDGLFLEHIS